MSVLTTARTDRTLLLIAGFAVVKLIFHTIVNQQYGFHRDELATLDDARHLAWGYVAYPPFTPFIGRLALTLFGESLAGFRFFAAMAQSVAIVLAASMAKHLGGNHSAQWLTALAVAISGVSLSASSLFQYVSFDYLWWVLIAWLIVRLVETDDRRWWVAIGSAVGLGFLTKYTILVCVAGLAVGVLATPLRKHLVSPWLWAGVVISLVIASPNLVWQMKHDFITLEFLKSIHARDVSIGRTDNFFVNQLFVPANPATVPLWSAGLIALFISPSLSRFRVLGWMAVSSFAIFAAAQGRDYYAASIYPMLLAAGASWVMSRLDVRAAAEKWVMMAAVPVLLLAGAFVAAIVLPIAPVGSHWWKRALAQNGDLREQFGWPELVAEVARIWNTIPENERARAAIFCTNYGQAGAINLYGPRYGLPQAISGVNSFWARGYGNPPPETVIVLGGQREWLQQRFESVILAGRVPNSLGVENEESRQPDIYLCRRPREPWSELWPKIRKFG
ncbi:glycosyltransferase family 39 protein [Pyrinomonas methylaliphatogenes]|uniref:PMT family glycosyltransferase, 4-amino-4-deoxy-L-arabinose transferase n=1 Tax=Pyrinomonas methylaliphatogenes TaxID=454194 RepID=A0A0B6WZY9_9BACT|nr:glycosyltransferase family 39 protein [Pyrinomonas methylaliphatogenes]CDM65874.1 PMT family glycosyltransferase, 4-amino-4-deoxy-L-arabinose transferase [Pyrinomonas methylaliphatogenes]